MVVASGARYRRPPIPNLADFEGAGVSYWATPVEAKLCEGEEVALVGGGNSAGQAVVFLAPKVKHLHLVVRGEGLRLRCRAISSIASTRCPMSNFAHQLPRSSGWRATAKAALPVRCSATARQRRDARCPLRHLFLFIGADPNAAWLEDCVAVDGKGFVVTGAELTDGASGTSTGALPLETSWPGVFAIGDVRAGSTKRVAAAVGEGAAVVAQIHSVLAAEQPQQR